MKLPPGIAADVALVASPGRKVGRGLKQVVHRLGTVAHLRIARPHGRAWIDAVRIFAYRKPISTSNGGTVKQSEFRRWLESQGVVVKDGTHHLKLYRDGRQSTMPRHPSKEINEKLRKAILKQLGL